jgi:hypothetical protein
MFLTSIRNLSDKNAGIDPKPVVSTTIKIIVYTTLSYTDSA